MSVLNLLLVVRAHRVNLRPNRGEIARLRSSRPSK
jgi:hypothetical protein